MSLKKKYYIFKLLLLISLTGAAAVCGFSFVMAFQTEDLQKIFNVILFAASITYIICATFFNELIESVVNKISDNK